MEDELITAVQAKKIAQCSVGALLSAIADGRLKAIQVPSPKRLVWKMKRSDLDAFLATGKKRKSFGSKGTNTRGRSPYMNRGYRYLHMPDHHRADNQGYVGEHIVVLEKHLGIQIKKPAQVHHKNSDKADNRPENLALVENYSDHITKYHSLTVRLFRQLTMKVKSHHGKVEELTDDMKIQLFNDAVQAVRQTVGELTQPTEAQP